MKKIATIFVVSMLLLLISFSFSTAMNENKTFYVDDDGTADYTSIQDAVDVAVDGDTVFVYSGMYYEHVIIDAKSITLRGENKETTIIDAEETDSALLIHDAEDVTVSEFTFQNSGDGYNECGVYVHESDNCLIEESIMQKCSYGITVFVSSNIVVTNNIMRENKDGVKLSDTTNVEVTRNLIENNQFNGIYVNYCKSGSITENNFINNKRHFRFYGIYFVDIDANYWQRIVQLGIKPIYGYLFLLVPIPGYVFDWNPASEPYGIGEE